MSPSLGQDGHYALHGLEVGLEGNNSPFPGITCLALFMWHLRYICVIWQVIDRGRSLDLMDGRPINGCDLSRAAMVAPSWLWEMQVGVR